VSAVNAATALSERAALLQRKREKRCACVCRKHRGNLRWVPGSVICPRSHNGASVLWVAYWLVLTKVTCVCMCVRDNLFFCRLKETQDEAEGTRMTWKSFSAGIPEVGPYNYQGEYQNFNAFLSILKEVVGSEVPAQELQHATFLVFRTCSQKPLAEARYAEPLTSAVTW
jgi:hypothetical protein